MQLVRKIVRKATPNSGGASSKKYQDESPSGSTAPAALCGDQRGPGRFSMASEESLGQLQSTNDQLLLIETRTAEIRVAVPATKLEDLEGLRKELGQLESRAKELETKGVDDVYTSSLNSGKQTAKDSKKVLLQRLEALFARFEEIFGEIKKRHTSSNASPGQPAGSMDVKSRSGARLSMASFESLDKLRSTSDDLVAIESRVAEIGSMVANRDIQDLEGLRTELSLLETRAKQLETRGVDDVYTSDLNSGKQAAKDSKKDMLQRLDALFSRFEQIFGEMKQCGASSKASSCGRRVSMASEESLAKLQDTSADLHAIETRVAEIEKAVAQTGIEDLEALRNELAKLETRAKQLETKGVDDVYTSALNSGKQEAKDSKKEMLQRLEALFSRLEKIFARIKQRSQSFK